MSMFSSALLSTGNQLQPLISRSEGRNTVYGLTNFLCFVIALHVVSFANLYVIKNLNLNKIVKFPQCCFLCLYV